MSRRSIALSFVIDVLVALAALLLTPAFVVIVVLCSNVACSSDVLQARYDVA